MKKTLEIIKEFIPILIGFIAIWIIRQEIIISIILILILLLTFKIKYNKNEIYLFIFGIITGFVIEVGSDLIYKLQYWENGSLFGIPIWLPLLWGYGFIFIRRIGNIIVK